VLDTRRFSAVVRSLGATPEQTVAGYRSPSCCPRWLAAWFGIPARMGARHPVAEILQAETPLTRVAGLDTPEPAAYP
jgi:hypothetical protein